MSLSQFAFKPTAKEQESYYQQTKNVLLKNKKTTAKEQESYCKKIMQLLFVGSDIFANNEKKRR